MVSKYYVALLQWDVAEPIYHAFDAEKWKTECGRLVSVSRFLYPLRHVRRFARPCKGCYPGGNDA